MKAQLTLEAIISISAFLVFLLLLFYSLSNMNSRLEIFHDEMSSEICALETAELVDYFRLDGLHSHFSLSISVVVDSDGKGYCTRGNTTSSSETLVEKNEKEPM